MHDELARLFAFARRHPRLLVLTGAGCSTDSGIPDYRDAQGQWKRAPPMTYQAFTGDAHSRQRYWARSLVGWRVMGQAQPGKAHHALAALECAGHVPLLLTQNVDGLHHAAGSQRVIDLHGRIDTVVCLACRARLPRADFQSLLHARNPGWQHHHAAAAPDGDADLDGLDFAHFDVPPCPHCGAGLLKPDVVFFGENVPRARVDAAMARLARADGMLVVGSSLMVYSGLRFVHAAVRAQIPVAAVNLGRTRADDLLRFRMAAPCGDALRFLLAADVPAPVMPPAAAAG